MAWISIAASKRIVGPGPAWLIVVLALLPVLIAARPVSDRWYLAESGSVLTHGPLLGAVTDQSVRVWARSSESGVLQVELKPNGLPWSGTVSGAARLAPGDDFTATIEVGALSPATQYDYRVLLNGWPTEGGSFRTLPPGGRPGSFRFAVGGDLYGEQAPFTILDRVPEQRPAFNLLLGDLIYSDFPEPIPATVEAYRQKYRQNWSEPSFRRLTAAVPSFTTWDDHEIVNDFDGADSVRYQAARTALNQYAGANPTSLRPGALYYQFQVADVDFFVLDTRSHRGRNAAPDGPTKSMLGATQLADLKAWLSASRAPFKVIVSSVPFHDVGPRRADSWTAFAAERADLLEVVRQREIGGVVVLSGDQHWSSLIRHAPYDVWEFNATPLAQYVQSGPLPSDPRLVMAYNSTVAFGIVDVDTRGARPRMSFEVHDADGAEVARHTIEADPPRR